MFVCRECGAKFDEPEYETVCLEEYNGESSLFGDRHYATFASCPECGETIDFEDDVYYEEDEDED